MKWYVYTVNIFTYFIKTEIKYAKHQALSIAAKP